MAEPAAKPKVNGRQSGLCGCRNGKVFQSPSWVDHSKPPGHTSMDSAYNPSLKGYLTGAFLFYSPNFLWLTIALGTYFAFPYDFEAARSGWNRSWVMKRALVNTGVTLSYVGFWHVSLYLLGMGKRPFNGSRVYRWSKLCHNVFYTLLGILQWTVWEVVFLRCYATGRIPYMSDAKAMASPYGIFCFLAWCFLVPAYRDFHFYFAHRFIHYKPMYKFVHSVHHRNTDVEPFAGLSMHPVEHLYYFSCVGPSIYAFATPMAMMWNGMHLLLSPAASHSGWEDNLQSDQFHYLHHRFFECNYGTAGVPWDRWFGTFRDKLHGKSSTYKGEATVVGKASAKEMDAKATLLGLPNLDSAAYSFCYLSIFYIFYAALNDLHGVNEWELFGVGGAHLIGLIVSAGPFIAANVLVFATSISSALKSPRKALTYPFHKEGLCGLLGFHFLFGLLFNIIPVYHIVTSILLPPGESISCRIWGC